MAKFVKILLFVNLLITTTIFADIYCPASVICTGTNISTCQSNDSNFRPWNFVSQTRPVAEGQYIFKGAFMPDALPVGACGYQYIGPQNIELKILMVTKSTVIPDAKAPGNNWNMQTYWPSCDSTDPHNCPFYVE